MTNVLYNEGFHTTLTWLQLAVGLVIGLLGVYAFTAMERVSGQRRVTVGGSEPGTSAEPESSPHRDEPSPFLLISMRAAYHNLGVLAASRKPVAIGTIVHRVRLAQIARRDKVLLTSAAVRNSLERLLAQGSLKMEGRGLAITEAGMELFNKIAQMRERGSLVKSSPVRVEDGGTELLTRHEAESHNHSTTSPLGYGSRMRSRHFFPTEILLPQTSLPDGFPALDDASRARTAGVG